MSFEAFKCNLQDLDVDDVVMASVLFQVRDALTERYTERLTTIAKHFDELDLNKECDALRIAINALEDIIV